MKLHEKFKDQGLVIVVTLKNKDERKNQAIHFLRSRKIPLMVSRNGRVRLRRKVLSMPASVLFDEKGKIVGEGSSASLTRKIIPLVKGRPHWLAEGRKFKKLGKYADTLKRTTAYGGLLKKLEKQLEKKEPAREEAKFLIERIRAYGKRKLEEARKLESNDAKRALDSYQEIARKWKGENIAESASRRVEELKQHPEFQKELEAMKIANQIFLERDKFIHGETFKIDHPVNKKIAYRIRALSRKLKKRYPQSQGAKKVTESLLFYGIEL